MAFDCAVEVGPHHGNTRWRDILTGMVVCTRHKMQFLLSDEGPFDFKRICVICDEVCDRVETGVTESRCRPCGHLIG